MKLHIVSDIHNEFGETYIPTVEADVMIIAGDIDSNIPRLLSYLKGVAAKYKHIIYVLGNHEFYRESIEDVKAQLRALPLDNVYLLDNSTIELEGKVFYGGTAFTDFNASPDEERDILRCISDFRLIEELKSNAVNYMQKEHEHFKMAMPKEVDVIVSHFVPDMQWFTAPMFIGNSLNPYFSSTDLRDYFKRTKLWIFGHTHHSFDEEYEGTRFICNPKGYPQEYKNDFDTGLVCEI